MTSDPRQPDGRSPRRRGPGTLGWVACGLLLAMLVTLLVQLQQYSLLQAADAGPHGPELQALQQIEPDYLRLRQAWRDASQPALAGDVSALRQPYASWRGHFDALLAHHARAPTQAALGVQVTHAVRQALDQVLAFTQAADGRLLAAARTTDATPQWVADRLPALEALAQPMQELAQGTVQSLSRQQSHLAKTLLRQHRLALGTGLWLLLLSLAFGAIAWHQTRAHRRGRREQRHLAHELQAMRGLHQQSEHTHAARAAASVQREQALGTALQGLYATLEQLRQTPLAARQVDLLHDATTGVHALTATLQGAMLPQAEALAAPLAAAPPGSLRQRAGVSPLAAAPTGPAAADRTASLLPRALLQELQDLLAPMAAARSLVLQLDIAPGVPQRIVADPAGVKQIVLGLLSRALQAATQGTVLLDLQPRPGKDGGHELAFVVSFQAAVADAGGPGLDLLRRQARQLGGRISLRGQSDEGWRLHFSLPLQPAAAPAGPTAAGPVTEADAPADARRVTACLPAQPPPPVLQILVAEDHPVNREYVAALLDRLGHQAHFTGNGREALQAVHERRFDLVLMDLHMPLLDGVETTRAIRALPDRERSTVPILALTADTLEATRERCLLAGMNDFLLKPISADRLAAALRRLFGSAAGLSATALPDPAELPLRAPAPATEPALLDEPALQAAQQLLPGPKLSALMDRFFAEGPATVLQLRDAVRRTQPQALRLHAHAAGGAALNLGLAALAHTARALHEGAALLPAYEIARLVQRYEDLLPATRDALIARGLAHAPAPPAAGAAASHEGVRR